MNPWRRLIGMIAAPRATLTEVVVRPRSIDLAMVILFIAATSSVTFLATGVGRLAALDQQVQRLESVGTSVTDERYAQLLALQPYQPLLGAAAILVGWPILWILVAAVLRAAYNLGTGIRASFAQVLAVVVHAASVFALRAVIAWPIDYARESRGGATTLGTLFPMFGEATFGARLLGAIDLFAIWWIALLALGLGILYERRATSFARWLFGSYAAGATLLAITQAVRGGV
jgi:hypothetical protein